MQRSIWLEWLREPTSSTYTFRWCYKFEGQLNIKRLDNALRSFLQKHTAYRTKFGEDSGIPYQFIESIPSDESVLKIIDGRNETEEAIQQYIDKEANAPFDLYHQRLFRYILIERTSNVWNFVVAFHHVIYDGLSGYEWIKDFSDMYKQCVTPDTVQPTLTVDDWHTHEKQYSAELLSMSKEHWRQYLDGSTVIEFPNLPSSSKVEEQGGEITRFLSHEVMTHLKEFNRKYDSSVFKTLLSVFQILVYRYTGEKDITVMYPKNLRPDALKELSGYYAALQPMRTHVEQGTCFMDIVSQAHHDMEEFKELLPFDFSTGSVDFNFIFARTVALWDFLPDLGDQVKVTWVEVKKIACVRDISLVYDFYEKTIGLKLEYNSQKYSKEYMEQVLGHYNRLLELVLENPNQYVDTLPLLLPSELDRALYEWNDTDSPYPKDKSMVDIFEHWSITQPDAEAVVFQNQKITYGELNRRANQMAHYLLDVGVKIETLVAVSMPRSIDLIVAIVAIIKAGAAYVPLDPDHPVDRLQYMLDDSNAAVVIAVTDDETDSTKQSSLLEQATRYPDHNPRVNVGPNNLVKVMYTSGSTGKPKGVMIEHQGLIRLVMNTNLWTVSPGDRMCQVANTSFDASSLEIWSALLNGATLVIIPTTTLLATDKFINILQSGDVNFLAIATGIFDQIATECPTAFEKLKALMVGGDKLSPATVRKILQDKAKAPKSIINAYGPTENSNTSTAFAFSDISPATVSIPIGKAISNSQVYVLDKNFQIVPIGVIGELYCAGDGLARGYLNQPQMTADRFILHTFPTGLQKRLYKTGDLARYLPDGSVDFIGRIDDGQVKIRGIRIELGEIESHIKHHPIVKDTTVSVYGTRKALVGYVVLKTPHAVDNVRQEIRNFLQQRLPSYMVPSDIVVLDQIPLTTNGKVDRAALPSPHFVSHASGSTRPRTEYERVIMDIWKNILQIDEVSLQDNFFDIGGHSLLVAQVRGQMPDFMKEKVTIMDLYKYPTIEALVGYLNAEQEDQLLPETIGYHNQQLVSRDIAIIGLAGRFPNADSVEELWNNVSNGVESIRFFSKEDFADSVSEELLDNPNYVRAKGMLKNVAGFDAEFFGFTPREAQITDPQQRVFLEIIHDVIESAGYNPKSYTGRVGIFGGVGTNEYMNKILSSDLSETVDKYTMVLCNEKDFLCSKVAYKLGLKGPAVTIQTACSTSLVAVHQASQSLLANDCDMAVAGGVSFGELDRVGYLYQQNMIMSPDGHCRVFDENAAGTVVSQGAGVVLLKPLEKAIADRDHIYAVIKGSSINNDGSTKIGFTAPSDSGQADAIRNAYTIAGIDPSSVSYIETHGTGTQVGDPIEISGLSKVFRGEKKIAIGSIKSNIGHLDTAAGAAGLINATLAIYHKVIPPTLHFQNPNAKLNIDKTPFYVNSKLTPIAETDNIPLRAGVSSFGLGGTNAHAVIEQAPKKSDTVQRDTKSMHILSISARNRSALEDSYCNIMKHLQENRTGNLADIAYTLHTGRRVFNHRISLLCSDIDHAIEQLENDDLLDSVSIGADSTKRPYVFVFPGSGTQHTTMAIDLYMSERVFALHADLVLDVLKQKRGDLFSEFPSVLDLLNSDKIHIGPIMHTSIFLVQYSMAKLLMSWGIEPTAMLGHSLGEYAAATIAGVFTLEDVLGLLAFRGELVQDLPAAAMLSIRSSEERVRELINGDIDIAVVNSPTNCVVSGTKKVITSLIEKLNNHQIDCTQLPLPIAFHSRLLDPVLHKFSDYVKNLALKKPNNNNYLLASNCTGVWHNNNEIATPEYWVRHLRSPVKFAHCVTTVTEDPSLNNAIFIELGPGKSIGSLIKQQIISKKGFTVVNAMRHMKEQESDTKILLSALSRIWLEGGQIDWTAYYKSQCCYRVPLPTYPFQRKRFWIDLHEANVRPRSYTQMVRDIQPDKLRISANSSPDFIQQRIVALWKKLLGHEDINLNDDFFEIGGDSLVAVRLLAQLKEYFKVNLPAHTIIQCRTVSQQAESVRHFSNLRDENHQQLKHQHPYSASLIPIQKGKGLRIPIYMVHAVGGDVYGYDKLAIRLGPEQPLFAFRAISLDGDTPPVSSIEAMARTYVEVLEQQQPEGPLILGGLSFGGIVALEMAQILQRKHRKIPLLVLLDSPISSSVPKRLDEESIMEYLTKYKLASEVKTAGINTAFLDTWMANQDAMRSYTPNQYSGDVVYFKPVERLEEFNVDPILPWFDIINGEIRVFRVPGNHTSMLTDPTVTPLAQKLTVYLSSVNHKST
jgi:amino acid adenylation domain-containing protein